MKKISTILILLFLVQNVFALSFQEMKASFEKEFATEIEDAKEMVATFKETFNPDEEELEIISWAEYELKCIKEDIIPVYSEYLKLVPQCYGDNVEELNKIFKGE